MGDKTIITMVKNTRFNCRLRRLLSRSVLFLTFLGLISASACADNPTDTTGTGIIIGGDGWLFDQNSAEYGGYTGDTLFSDEELEEILSVIKQKRSFFAKTNTDLIVVIVPDKMNTYSDKLPDEVKSLRSSKTRLSQVHEHIKKNTRVSVVDMTELFSMNSAAFDLYQRTGAALSDMGAYLVYTEIVKAVNALNISELNLAAIDSFAMDTADDNGLSLAERINSAARYKNNTLSLTYKKELPFKTEETGSDKLLVTTIPEENRLPDYRYTNLILYGTENNISAVNKFVSLTFKMAVYSTGFVTDAADTLEYKPGQAVFLISESELDLLKTGESLNMELFEEPSAETQPPVQEELSTNDPDPSPDSLEPVPPNANTCAAPIITGKIFSDRERLAVAGVAEAGTTLRVLGSSDDSYTYFCENGIFLLDLYCTDDIRTIKVTATADGKNDSEAADITITRSMPRNNKGAFVGKAGHIHINETANDFLGNGYSESALKNKRSRLERQLSSIQQVSPDTKFIVMVAPNHSTIYPETMPDWLAAMKQDGAVSRLGQMYAAMEGSPVIFLNLTEVLLAKKAEADFIIYNKTDTHWNELGAYYAYEYLMNEIIAPDFPAAKAIPLSEFDVFEKNVPGGDMLNFLGFNLELSRENGVFVRPKNFTFVTKYDKPYNMNFDNIWTSGDHSFKMDNAELPTMVMMRDSFSSNLINFMAQNFRESYFYPMWSYNMDMDYIEKHKPDYVILEAVERNIDGIG